MDLAQLEEAIAAQGEKVKNMKAAGQDVSEEVPKLLALKDQLPEGPPLKPKPKKGKKGKSAAPAPAPAPKKEQPAKKAAPKPAAPAPAPAVNSTKPSSAPVTALGIENPYSTAVGTRCEVNTVLREGTKFVGQTVTVGGWVKTG